MSAELLRGLGPRHSDWVLLDAARVQAFANATEDWQPIHLDSAAGAASPFGTCVAHGFLTLSMLSAMSYQVVPDLPGMRASVNYGFDRIRFVAPVPVGARIRGGFELAQLDEQGPRLTAHWDVAIEIDNKPKPALIARWITRFEMEE